MVIFGAGGDLTKRLVTPALYNLARSGVHYIGQPEDNCFCLPTCGPDLAAGDFPHYHSVEEALAQGLVPCNLCRPMAA